MLSKSSHFHSFFLIFFKNEVLFREKGLKKSEMLDDVKVINGARG